MTTPGNTMSSNTLQGPVIMPCHGFRDDKSYIDSSLLPCSSHSPKNTSSLPSTVNSKSILLHYTQKYINSSQATIEGASSNTTASKNFKMVSTRRKEYQNSLALLKQTRAEAKARKEEMQRRQKQQHQEEQQKVKQPPAVSVTDSFPCLSM